MYRPPHVRLIKHRLKQAEAEVVLSSSLVEVMLEVWVEVEVEVEVGFLRCNLDLSLVVVSTFTGGWSGGRKIGG